MGCGKMNENVEILEKLSDKQQQAILLLLLGDNNKTVASKIGVDENTVYRWRNEPIFKSALLDMRIQSLESIETKLHSLGDNALNKLKTILNNAENENNQLKASIFILEKILQYEQLQLLKRLDAIEERLDLI